MRRVAIIVGVALIVFCAVRPAFAQREGRGRRGGGGLGWFRGGDVDATAVTPERFAGVDRRYLELLHSLSLTVERLAQTSVTFDEGSTRTSRIDVAAYRMLLERERMRAERDPSFGGSVDIVPTGDPALPYQVTRTRTESATRIVAGPELLGVEVRRARGEGETRTFQQRAWGGFQVWRQGAEAELPPPARLLPAGGFRGNGPSRRENRTWREGYADVIVLTQALATLVDGGPPGAIFEETDASGRWVYMLWERGDGTGRTVIADPRKDHVPVGWIESQAINWTRRFDRMATRRPNGRLGQAMQAADPATVQDWVNTLPNERFTQVTFDGWRETAGGAWLPGWIERVRHLQRAEGDEVVEATFTAPPWLRALGFGGTMSGMEQQTRIAWRDRRGQVSAPEAFTPPPAYEAYAGQQWVHLTLEPEPEDRLALVERLLDGAQFARGMDAVGTPRWIVAAADRARLGAWPLEEGDVLLGAGPATSVRPNLEPRGTDQSPVDEIGAAIAAASAGSPAIVRLARDTTLLDVVCWAPASDAAEDVSSVAERIAATQEYPPLPHERFVEYATAVRDATTYELRR